MSIIKKLKSFDSSRIKMPDEKDKNGSSGEDDGLDVKDSVNGWDISLEISTLKRHLVALDYFTINGLQQAFNALDAKNSGCVAKTQLQIICINLCTVLNVPFSAEDLTSFQSESSDLSFEDFQKYITVTLLTKITNQAVDLVKLDEISWTIFEKQRKHCQKKTLTDNELFKMWQAFNKVNINISIKIDIEEAAMLLDEFMKAIGTPWTRGPLDDTAEGKLELSFWELIDCLETKYLHNTSQSVYSDGITAVYDKYVREIIKCGMLVKKGHRIKSFKERWFVLNPRIISYYEGKSEAKKKGIIVLDKDSKCEATGEKNSKHRFIVVSSGEKKVEYQMEANDNKTKNEWMSAIQRCIDCSKNNLTPLITELRQRATERNNKREKQSEEERLKKEQEEIIKRQLEELELVRNARDEAQAQAENEAALKEEERKRREELEALKAEYERLLEEEKQARILENQARDKQQKILEEEMLKRQELEAIKAEQDRILEEERKAREGLEELSKEQQKTLNEEREKLKSLDEARKAAEEEVEATRAKLEAAECERQAAARRVEEAKERARKMKVPVGLAKPLTLEQKQLITHRGAGAFVDSDFSKTPIYLSSEERPVAVNQSELLPEGERAVIEETNLVKPSTGKDKFEGTS